MSRHTNFQFRGEREGRVAQMSRQEEIIAKKRQELLEKHKTSELAKKVAAAQSATAAAPPPTPAANPDVKHPSNLPKQTFEAEPLPPKNTFTNDGSFFENFRKITEAAKKAEEEKQRLEAERLARQKELEEKQKEIEMMPELIEPMPPMPPLNFAFSTNSMAIGPGMKMPNIFPLLAAPPPPPPPAVEPDFNAASPFPNPRIQPPPQFEGNNYLNENPLNRNCGNSDQMERNFANPHPSNNVPELNSELNTSNTAALKATIPTTIDGLIEYIASNGDDFEEQIKAQIAQMNERTLFRFLNDKDSDNYKMYREKVLSYRAKKLGQASKDSNDKYDPEAILHDDDDENDVNNAPPPTTINHFEGDEDEFDSDSEYRHEAMERNLENMKRLVDSGNSRKRYAENSYLSDEGEHTDEDDHMEMYRRIQMLENASDSDEEKSSQLQQEEARLSDSGSRKKRSRWGDKLEAQPTVAGAPSTSNPFRSNRPATMLSAIRRTDAALLNYARQNYGTTDLSEEDWVQCEEHFKVNLLYQDMLRKRDEIDRLAKSGQNKYEYDSDEDTTGGTWEHKMRTEEMEATAAWTDALNKQSEGKHHIGDFLPPEELKKFMEIYKSKQTNREPDLSDYKEYKLTEDNKGFQMLQKLGWTEGKGLGVDGGGIINPVNKATQRDSNQGLGLASNTTPEAGDNEYDAYRKRMMLAYRFRPNPLNNPRRAYY